MSDLVSITAQTLHSAPEISPDPAPEISPASIKQLSRRAKAAIVVRLLLNDGADIPLEELPDELQARLTHQMGAMRLVDRTTLYAVAAEFANEIDQIGLSFPAGLAGALDALDGRISPATAARLRAEAGIRAAGDPWERLNALEAKELASVAERESVEVAAVLLSKLPVPLAAELLSQLPGPHARRITYAVSQTTAVTPDAVDRIGLSLASQFDAQPARAFADDPAMRIGEILNSSPFATRDDVLTGLDETDKGVATRVRKAIFTFTDIPRRIAARDVPRILREVEGDVLVRALAGAAARDYLLDSISQRMAGQLREEMEEAGTVRAEEAEEAMGEVVTAIRTMEQTGNLQFVEPEPPEA